MKETRWKTVSNKHITSTESVISVLLENRGLVTQKAQNEFFSPEDPTEIPLSRTGIAAKSVEQSIKRIENAKNQKIIIYGDYDADGICATAILWECLYDLGFDCIPYIPDRFSDGYGLNAKSVTELKKNHTDLSLIITVDNGVVAHSGVEKAKELGIDVIITDHHEKGETYPDAYSVIHSQAIGGAGISWYFSRELKRYFGKTNLSDGIDLAAIGTVTDQIPLLSLNRSIVTFGLRDLNKKERLGLVELYRSAGIFSPELEIDTYTIGFMIGPRLNAMGRLEHAIDSLRLLCTNNRSRARELATYLEKTNKKRQEIVEEVVLQAHRDARKQKNNKIIVLANEDYHEGVVGLAASKLVEEYYKPALVFSILGDEAKASARSVEGFNIIEAIRNFEDILLAAGGHPMAAGVKISTNKIKEFTKKINLYAEGKLPKDALVPEIKVDLRLPFELHSWDLIEKIKDFAPFGTGNSRPLFLTNKVTVISCKTVGKENTHLKLTLSADEKTIDAIGFGLGWIDQELDTGSEVDLVYSIEENEFRGVKSMQLRVKDIRVH